MAYFDPEIQLEVNRQRLDEELRTIHLQNKATEGKSLFSRGLASLGAWMVARGETLRRKNTAPQARYAELNKKTAHR
jgi:hypothetical protein